MKEGRAESDKACQGGVINKTQRRTTTPYSPFGHFPKYVFLKIQNVHILYRKIIARKKMRIMEHVCESARQRCTMDQIEMQRHASR
jgi:hypothetical protein